MQWSELELLHADNVSFNYGERPVLRGVSVTVPRGGLLGILGPNGAGKTTFLQLLAGMSTPSTGQVTFDGMDISKIDRSHLARRMAIVPQETSLTFDYTVLEVALMGRHPHLRTFEIEGPIDLKITREALAATGTIELENRTFRSLSGGEKQRVIIASALAQFEQASQERLHFDKNQASTVLLLDEPTTSLDLHYQLALGTILKKLNRERKITIVISTHDLNFAATLCQELVLLRDGRTIAVGRTEQILTSESVRKLYDVDAAVQFHEASGHVTVVPLDKN